MTRTRHTAPRIEIRLGNEVLASHRAGPRGVLAARAAYCKEVDKRIAYGVCDIPYPCLYYGDTPLASGHGGMVSGDLSCEWGKLCDRLDTGRDFVRDEPITRTAAAKEFVAALKGVA